MKRIWVSAILLLGSGFLPQKEEQLPLFRVSSTAVLVDFLAVDRDGRPVRDLRREEIEIFEDGKKQAVETFLQPGSPLKSSLILLPPAPAGDPRHPATPPPARPAEDPESSQTVIVIDSRAIDSNNLVHSVAAIRAFIENHLEANHSIMLAEINRGLKVLTPLTRDQDVLLAVVNQIKPQTVYNPLDASRASLRGSEGYLDELSLQVAFVRESLLALCYSLAGQKGRKHVVYFSEGYPMNPVKLVEMNARQGVAFASADARQAAAREVGSLKDPQVLGMIREVVSAANLAGVSFYTVDAQGLRAVQGAGSADFSANVAAGPGAGNRTGALVNPPIGFGSGMSGASEFEPSEAVIAAYQLVTLGNLQDAQNTLAALAAGTNGLAFFNANNLGVVLNSSTREQQNYYLASYAPSGNRRSGQFRSISIKSTRPGIRIRGRMGYMDTSEGEARGARLSMAFSRPELFRYLSPIVQVEASRGAVRAVVGVPASQIHFRASGGGFKARISFQGAIYGSDGRPLKKEPAISKSFDLNLTEEQMRGIGDQPFLAQQEIKLAAGEYRLVLAVEDLLAGTVGTTVQEFRVP